jgi:hypothetical protein
MARPAIVVVTLSIERLLSDYRDSIAKFFFSLWIHHRLGLIEENRPTGFACWIQESVPAEFVEGIIRPENVCDRYNRDRK